MTTLYTCEQVAERYQIKILTVWEWIRTGKMSAIKIGKGYRIRESDLSTFEKNCEARQGNEEAQHYPKQKPPQWSREEDV